MSQSNSPAGLLLIALFLFLVYRSRKKRKRKQEEKRTAEAKKVSPMNQPVTVQIRTSAKPERIADRDWETDSDTEETVTFRKNIRLSSALIEKLSERFIAIDFETTGLSKEKDRIIQIGAVLFEDLEPTDRFTTFVNPGMPIPAAASRVNRITDEMVADAPTEGEAAEEFRQFLGDASEGETFLCAHNASFDMGFLSGMFSRAGIDADIHYTDTLALARKHIPGLPNYKQQTILDHLNLVNPNAHRADGDAEMCGKILVHILQAI